MKLGREKNRDILTAVLDLEKGCLIKAKTLAALIDSMAKTMEGISEELFKLGAVEILVKDIKIKKDRVEISLKPNIKTN
jgi:tRNA A58 N-methylase Trm61